MTEQTPAETSSDYKAMADYWQMIETIMGGTQAMRNAPQYLPRFANEQEAAYTFRRSNAKFTNIYRDIVENLAARPFAKEVSVGGAESPELAAFVEDVDGRGNHLHVFAADVFFAGINAAVDWILVDYTSDVPVNATRADEAAIGARPYWLRIPAQALLAAYSDMINGKEEFVHVRIWEPVTVRSGYGESTVNRVRVLNREPLDGGGYAPATFEVFEEQADTKTKKAAWISISTGPISIGVIPLVPFVTGRRLGSSWVIHPPMRDAAYLQIEHFQQESALKHIKSLTAFPMLAGNGVTPPKGDDGKPIPVPVGPQAVLYAPQSDKGAGSWNFIEPSATSLRFLADDIAETAKELRELGRQPLTAQSGNLTVVTTVFAAQKGNSAIQAWTLNLKDALEQAFVYAGMWRNTEWPVDVKIDTDFDLGLDSGDTFGHVLEMAGGDDPLISREVAVSEAKRRNILSADYDAEADLDVLMAEQIGDAEI